MRAVLAPMELCEHTDAASYLGRPCLWTSVGAPHVCRHVHVSEVRKSDLGSSPDADTVYPLTSHY